METISLFILFSGFIIGLGAVTVIDIHGFLGRKSSYWTEATVRTHKVTKPLIWAGISLVILGFYLTYKNILIENIEIPIILISILVLNGCFLSFYVSPILLNKEKEGKSNELLSNSLQNKITISFILSFLGWWSLLLYFVLMLTK